MKAAHGQGGRSRLEGRLWWGLVALACVVPTMPLLVVEVPPLLDYPNHLARMWLLGTQTGDPVLGRMLAPAWGLLPNLGTDAVLPWVMRVLPVHVAGRLMLAVLLVLPVLGVVALSGATFRARSAWALGAALVTCNGLFLMGFLNFSLACGLAMLLGAAWFRFRERRPGLTVLGCALGVGVLFFCHLSGVLFFLVLVGSYEVEMCWAGRGGRGLVAAGLRRALVALPLLAVAGVLYASTSLQGVVGVGTWWSPWNMKMFQTVFWVINYNLVLDLLTAVAVLGFLVWGVATGRVAVPLRWGVAIGGLALLYAAMPFFSKNLAWIDTRFSIMFGFALFAGVRLVRVSPGFVAGVVVAGGVILGVRTAVVAGVWHDYAADLAGLRWVIEPVEAGARVVTLVGREVGVETNANALSDGTALMGHRGALVMLDRRAFWPQLFADPSQQPVRWLPPYDALVRDTPALADYRALTPEISEIDKREFPLWQTWFERYDYVLLLESGGVTDVSTMGAGHLELLRRSRVAALFRIRR